MEARVQEVALRLRRPLRAAHGDVHERRLLMLQLADADGATGVGEAAPLPGYHAATLEDCRTALNAACAALNASGDRALALRAAWDAPPAEAAVDVAFWNLAAARAGRPLAELLGANVKGSDLFMLNATVGAEDGAQAAAEAAAALAAGFRCVKVKVGVGDDVARVAAVRDALGPEPLLRIDANGAWGVEEAGARLAELARFGIELCEEPVHGVEEMRAVRALSPVPVALDETATARGALVPGVAGYACLKLAAWGGISPLIAAARRARSAGMRVYVSSSLDGPVGIAASRAAAAAIRPDAACGLATLALFAPQTSGVTGYST